MGVPARVIILAGRVPMFAVEETEIWGDTPLGGVDFVTPKAKKKL